MPRASKAHEETCDELGELIVAKGLAPNLFQLDNDRSLSLPDDFAVPAPWNLPSRTFQFPIEVHPVQPGRPRGIGLRHPLLADHPFVQHVEAVLGRTLPREPVCNAFGYSSAELAQWWHAVDLVSAGHWRELMETAEFTRRECMFRAAGFALRSERKGDSGNRQTLREARGLLAWLGSQEPENRAASIRVMAAPSAFSDAGAMRCPINSGGREVSSEAEAWATIHGIEDGWMTYDRRGYLQWSELGQKRYAVDSGESFTEKDGQRAFAF